MATVIPGRWAPLPGSPSPMSRLDRLAGLDPERMAETLAFLSSYAPAVFDAVLAATEPGPADPQVTDPQATDPQPDDDTLEPYCTRCGARAGIFAGRSDDWQHYAGTPQARTVRPFDTDHAPAIGWRPARDGPALVTR
jgi:hypothetical protein